MQAYELLEQRLHPHYNVFPQDMEVVSLWHPRTTKEFHELGYLVGHSLVSRGSVNTDSIPREIMRYHQQRISKDSYLKGREPKWVHIHWLFETPRGQEVSTTKANLVGVIDAHWSPKWSLKAKKYTDYLEFSGMRFEIGCKHDFEHKNLGRCYNQGTCKKCGYFYRVDSGD